MRHERRDRIDLVVSLCKSEILGSLGTGIQNLTTQGRSTKVISMIRWFRTSRLSIKNAQFAVNFVVRHEGRDRVDLVVSLCRKVDIRLLEKGNSNSHGARPVQ